MKKGIFIGATGQNVGKTTLCLGVISGLKRRFSRIGFIKPVGQLLVHIDGDLKVDKDVVLFKEHFHLLDNYTNMSPVILPSGTTKEYLDGKIDSDILERSILNAYDKIAQNSDFTVVEGTGHIGVGSIVNMCNARVASILGLDIVIIASGGIGSTHDELALNIALCQQYGVKVRGVILNRVHPEKRDMVLNYFPKALKHWGIPLIGCIPFNECLSMPSMQDFETLFNTKLLWGEQHRMRHFKHQCLVSGSLENYQNDDIRNELVITPASRIDIIKATLQKHLSCMNQKGIDCEGGMILTGRRPISKDLLEQIKEVDLPVLHAPVSSYEAMRMITHFTAKIRNEDTWKVEKAIKLVEENINFEALC
jgi:BioD-like phosphotransacetylase family protein